MVAVSASTDFDRTDRCYRRIGTDYFYLAVFELAGTKCVLTETDGVEKTFSNAWRAVVARQSTCDELGTREIQG